MTHKAILVHEDVADRFNLLWRQKTTMTKTGFLLTLLNLYDRTNGEGMESGRTSESNKDPGERSLTPISLETNTGGVRFGTSGSASAPMEAPEGKEEAD